MSDRRRRKSLSILRPPLAPLTPIDDEPPGHTPPGILKKRRQPSSAQDQSPSSSPIGSGVERTNSRSSLHRLIPKDRQRSSPKSARPSSLFGSLRSLSSLQDEEEKITRTSSSPSSLDLTTFPIPDVAAGMLIHHGPLPEAGPMFRRRCPYLVLTEFHIIQFKSQSRAADMFPGVPGTHNQSRSSMRHSRLSSNSSLHDLQSSSDGHHSVPLLHVVAVYKLDDGEPYFSIEIAHLNESTNHASTMTLQIHDPGEADTWLTAIRSAATKARMTSANTFPQGLIEYTARALEQEHDYDPDHFHMFKVVQRANKSGKRSSSDDLTKLTSKICILAIGMYKVHLVPLPKSTRTASSTSLSDMNGASHGIMNLVSVNLQTFDDSFQLWFRNPFQPSLALHLSALCVHEIAVWLRQAAEYLRPEWTEQPFAWIVPQTLNDELLPMPAEGGEYRSFDRTLTAYCSAYTIDTSNIRYSVDHTCEDGPKFALLPTDNPRRPKYNSLELLAVLRALRYNESFKAISLSNISLDILNGLCDQYGWEHTPWTTKSGQPVELEEQQKASVLIQEIRALAIKSRRLRRMEFSGCIARRPESAGANQDAACGICEALFPVCAKQYTNVDWIILNGIQLSDADIDYLYAAAVDKTCHFRAIEVAFCGLADRSFQAIIQALSHQRATLECLNFSGNFARLEPLALREYLDEFAYIRIANFSNIYRTSGQEPLFELSTLMHWRLQELDLSRSPINAETLRVLTDYLKDLQSESLKTLRLVQCGLTGGNIDDLLQAMTRSMPRALHLDISDNRLEVEHERLIKAIGNSLTPIQMTMQMLEYKEEKNFRLLVLAWASNTSTSNLDMSKVSLPSAAGSKTVAALEHMLAENKPLEYLDIAGEEAHLEVANYGVGLNRALTGLKRNRSLKVLHVEHQKLGMQGANTLASILEENSTLLELHCAGNGFSLQAFTVIVASLAHNTTLRYLPSMDEDRAAAIRKFDREFENSRDTGLRSLTAPTKATVVTMTRSIGAAMPGPLSFANRHSGPPIAQGKRQYTEFEANILLNSLSQNWDKEIALMVEYLERNYKLAQGLPLETSSSGAATENERPTTGTSTSTVKRIESNEATPTGEPSRQLGIDVGARQASASEESERAEGVDGEMEAALMMSKKLNIE
ncbi:MAG: hypothetical protein L6R41_007151 [Letrouitia leprolyta]|nr:MAG: hypothetical protein L6R41_007151 [Letrouitia leprolyta]